MSRFSGYTYNTSHEDRSIYPPVNCVKYCGFTRKTHAKYKHVKFT